MADSKFTLNYKGKELELEHSGISLEGVESIEVDENARPPVAKVVGKLAAEEYVHETPAQLVIVHTEDGDKVKHGDVYLQGVSKVTKNGDKVELEISIGSVNFKEMVEEKPAPKKPVVKPAEKKEAGVDVGKPEDK